MHRNALALLITPLLFVMLLATAAEASESVKTIQVLGIGNSFTNNAYHFLGDMSDASGSHKLGLGRAVIGGCSLDKHHTLLKEHEADAAKGIAYSYIYRDPITGESSKQKTSLKTALTARQWDVVTIQQVSRLSNDLAAYKPHAAELVKYIQTHAPQATIMIHQTWAYRIDGDFAKVWPTRKGYSQADMYRDSAKAYQDIATELGINIIPVGAAFQLARERQPFVASDVDASAFTKPELPAQENSLNVGYAWRKNELGQDSHHANTDGCFLAGLVWFETLTQEDVSRLDLSKIDIKEERKNFLQSVAHEVVSKKLRPAIQP